MTDRGDEPVVVGLLTDPGLAATIARHLADELADRLAEQVDDRVCRRVEGTGWDIAVAITDLPLQTTNGVVVAELSRADCVALLSLPALGGIALRRRAREAVVRIVDELTPTITAGPDGDATGPTSLRRPRPLRTAHPVDSDLDDELVIAVASTPSVNTPSRTPVPRTMAANRRRRTGPGGQGFGAAAARASSS